LNFPAKKREAARIDDANIKFATRIMQQKPLVANRVKLEASHKQKLKTLQMISQNSRISISKIVQQNATRFAHVEAPMSSFNKLPPLKSLRDQSQELESGLVKKKLISSD